MAGRSEGGLGSGFLLVADCVLGQLGRTDGLRRGQTVRGVKEADRHGDSWARGGGGGSVVGGDDGRAVICLLRELRDGGQLLGFSVMTRLKYMVNDIFQELMILNLEPKTRILVLDKHTQSRRWVGTWRWREKLGDAVRGGV